jgi:hypothetical protein
VTSIDLGRGGGYIYQWECAILLALNYLMDTPTEYKPELHQLTENFLGKVKAVHLEGKALKSEIGEEFIAELEDINLLADSDRVVCIQVKTKEAEGERWTPSDRLLMKALYRFYCNPGINQDEPPVRLVFLSNRSFNPDLVQVKEAIADGTVAQSEQANALFQHLQKHVAADHPEEPALERTRFDRLLSGLALIEFLDIDQQFPFWLLS